MTPDVEPPLRADARENYERVLAAAIAVMAREGSDASLTAIAAEAGVGIGTLYRRFPSREHLIEAVHRSKVSQLCELAPEVLEDSDSPVTAMHTWAQRFIELLIETRGATAAIRPLLAPDSAFRTETRQWLSTAVTLILAEGRRNHSLRSDVDAIDVLRSLTGIAYVTQSLDEAQVPLQLLVDGLAYIHQKPTVRQKPT